MKKATKGDKGDTGEKGATGAKGSKGDKGDKGDVGEKGDKGDKGDAFTYSDFTPEQLESLKVKGDDGADGKDDVDGYSPTVVENANNTESDYKLDITDVNGTFTTPNLMGKQGIQGPKGERGETGLQGQQGIQGVKGDKGEDGLPFLIYKQYEVGIEEFNEADFPEVGLMFMVHVFEEGKGYPVYRYTADGTDTPYSLITYMNTEGIKGEKGDKGDTGEQGIAGIDGKDGTTYTPSIGEVTTVESNVEASASVSVNDETKEAVFNFAIPKGNKGLDGVQISDNETIENKTWSSKKTSDEIAKVDTELNAKLNGKADKNAALNSLEIKNSYTATQIIPWSDGTHYRSFEDKSSNTYTDIITNNGIAIIARIENSVMTKSEKLVTMKDVANSIIRENKFVLYNLNNADNVEVAIDIAKSGYKPIAVSLYNAGIHLWFTQGMYFNDTVCNLSLRGVTPSSATNAKCEVLVTYIKTS